MDSSALVNYQNINVALKEIEQDISLAKTRRQKEEDNDVILIAVSKKKPIDLIIEAYKDGQRHFGENYVHELLEKASTPDVLSKCPDIKWHFIGHLQTNKVKKLVQNCPNLYMVQTVDSIKVADLLNSCWEKKSLSENFKIMVQINTSEEASKSGTDAPETGRLVKHILYNCPHLCLVGLMTIGSANYDCKTGTNPDYINLITLRNKLCEQFSLSKLALSFGMSKDYQHAIELGSSYIRVGEKIFGKRALPVIAANEHESGLKSNGEAHDQSTN